MNTVNSEVVNEIYRAMENLGAGSDLLGIVGSWGDSLPEPQVLSMLRGWNEATERTRSGETTSRNLTPPQMRERRLDHANSKLTRCVAKSSLTHEQIVQKTARGELGSTEMPESQIW